MVGHAFHIDAEQEDEVLEWMDLNIQGDWEVSYHMLGAIIVIAEDRDAVLFKLTW